MTFDEFCQTHPVQEQDIYSAFFDLFKQTFAIKNKNLAVPKLKKILKATFKLSATQGFATMTLRQLCQETKMSMGGLYAYINSKKQLSLYIHQFLNQFVINIIDGVSNNHPEQTLEELIRYHVYISEVLQPWFFFVFMESKNLSPSQRKFAIQSELLMESKLVEAIEEGQALEIYSTILSATSIAAHIKPLLHDWYLKRWKYKQRKITIDDFCFSVLIFINRGLTSPHSLHEHSQTNEEQNHDK